MAAPFTAPSFPALPAGLDAHTLFQALFGAYPDSLLLVDQQGTIVLANPNAERLFGYAPGGLGGLNVDVLVPDHIRPRHAHYRHAYAQSPRARPMGTHMDLVGKRRDGSEVMVEIALSPLQQSGLPYVVVAVRGIGEYPRVKQALLRARYSEHVAKMGRLAVDTRDPQQLLQQVPEVAAEALEVETAMLLLLEPGRREFRVVGGVGLLPGECVGMRVSTQADAPAGHVLLHGSPLLTPDYLTETRVTVPPHYTQAGLVSGLAVPLYDRGVVMGVLKVRSRKAERFGDEEMRFLEALSNLLAATLQRLQTEETLQHAQRLESVGQLTGGIAHDFNNLLTVIQGNLQVLEEWPAIAGDADALAWVAAATRASRRAAELTAKLLAFSRRQVLSPSRIDAPAVVASLADMLRRTLDQRIRIDVESPPACPPCRADAGQLESALLNIAINARDAMPAGGVLRFTCTPCEALPPELAADFPEADTRQGFVAIAVADDGVGMSEAVMERAFEPFFTTKESGRGTGLGLSTVYGFVRQSQGAIALHSAAGVGTTVTLYLPRYAASPDPQANESEPQASLPPGLRVLMVEDEAEVRAVALRFLHALGCTVAACASSEEALAQVDGGAPVDLLLSDIALGAGMRGTELAREVQARRPEVAVLLMSGYSAELLDVSQNAPLSWELLAKPYSRDELQAAMLRALVQAGTLR